MRPGEVLPADGPVPAAPAGRRGAIRVRNTGRFPAYLGSHFPLARASAALEFSGPAVENARLDLPAGATACVEPGEELELPVAWI